MYLGTKVIQRWPLLIGCMLTVHLGTSLLYNYCAVGLVESAKILIRGVHCIGMIIAKVVGILAHFK